MSGLGKRFVESGYEDPKPLIIVDNFPIIEHVVNLFDKNNDKYIFICNDLHLKETNMRQVLNTICSKGKIFEVPVTGRQGPVHAVSLIFDNIPDDEEIIVSYCDYGTDWSYSNFLKDNRERDADGSIACYKGFHPHMLGTDNYAFLKEKELGSRWMEKIQEKQPFTDNRMDEYASNGTYYFKNGNIMKKYFQKLMDLEMKVKNEYYVSMVYNLLVEDGLKVNIFEIEKMLQWGTPCDLEIYNGWSKYFNVKKQTQQKFEDKHDTTIILPLAGKGSRFVKEGYEDPKPLLDVDGLPMIVSAVKSLPESSKQVFICLEDHLKNYPLEQQIKEYYDKSNIVSINKVTEGQACTIELGIKEANVDLESPILVSACDNGVHYNTEKYQSLIDDEKNDIIVWSFTNQQCSKKNPEMYGWIETDENDDVKRVSCKKFIEGVHDLEKSHVIIGTVFFRKAKYFLEGLQENYKNDFRTNGEFYLDDVINPCVEKGLKTKVFEVNHYICWGTPNEYKTYNYWKEHFNSKYYKKAAFEAVQELRNDEPKYLYLHFNKCGGRNIRNFLNVKGEVKLQNSHSIDKISYIHTYWNYNKQRTQLKNFIFKNNLKIFIVIRDPVDILLSSLNHRERKIGYFLLTLKSGNVKNQEFYKEIKKTSEKFINLHELIEYHKENRLDKNNMGRDMYMYEIIFLQFNIEINDLIENYDYKYVFSKILRTYSIYDYFSLVGGYENIKNRLLPVVYINSKKLCKIINYLKPEINLDFIEKNINLNKYSDDHNINKFCKITYKNRMILKEFFIKDYEIIEKLGNDGILIK